MNHVVGLIIARISTNVSAFVTLILVGRFLTPAEFGIFAVASALTQAALSMVGAGFYEHTLARDPEGRDEKTAHWCSVAMGATALVLLSAIAAVTWLGFDAKVYAIMIAGLSGQVFLWSLYVSHEARQLRDSHGKSVASISVIADIAGMIALVLSLNFNLGVYCLLVNRLVSGFISVALYWIMTPRPRGRFERSRAKEIGRTGLGMIGSRLMIWLNGYAGEFVIVAFLSAQGVGLYRMGGRLFQAIGSVFLFSAAPGITAMVGNAMRVGVVRLSNTVRRSVDLQLALAIPVMALAAVLAPHLIPLLLGPNWAVSITVFQIYCLETAAAILFTSNIAVLAAAGRSGALFRFVAISGVLGFVGISIGGTIGPEAAAAGHIVATTPVSLWVFWRDLGLIRTAKRSALLTAGSLHIAGAALVGAAWGLEPFLGESVGIAKVFANVVMLSLVGLTAYVVVLRLIAPHTFRLWRYILRHNLNTMGTRLGRLMMGRVTPQKPADLMNLNRDTGEIPDAPPHARGIDAPAPEPPSSERQPIPEGPARPNGSAAARRGA